MRRTPGIGPVRLCDGNLHTNLNGADNSDTATASRADYDQIRLNRLPALRGFAV